MTLIEGENSEEERVGVESMVTGIPPLDTEQHVDHAAVVEEEELDNDDDEFGDWEEEEEEEDADADQEELEQQQQQQQQGPLSSLGLNTDDPETMKLVLITDAADGDTGAEVVQCMDGTMVPSDGVDQSSGASMYMDMVFAPKPVSPREFDACVRRDLEGWRCDSNGVESPRRFSDVESEFQGLFKKRDAPVVAGNVL
jgi:hypothetical protein